MRNRWDAAYAIAQTLLLVIITLCLLTLHHEVDRMDSEIETIEKRSEECETAAPVKSLDLSDATDEPEIVEDVSVVDATLEETATVAATSEHDDSDDDYMAAVVGDLNYVLRVLTAEGGNDDLMCGLIAQCLYNACEKHDWRYTPAEMMKKYQYTTPESWVSSAAEKAYDDVFCSGVTYECVGNATVFYAPRYVRGTPWHESQRFAYEYGGVRFFEEIG